MVDNLYIRLGEEGLTRLIAAFYRRVRQDDLIGRMYPPNDWDQAEARLRDFLIFRFGGPDRYIQERGHPRLRLRHGPFSIGVAERDRWLDLMGQAMDEVAIPQEEAQDLAEFFVQVADSMRNRPEEPQATGV